MTVYETTRCGGGLFGQTCPFGQTRLEQILEPPLAVVSIFLMKIFGRFVNLVLRVDPYHLCRCSTGLILSAHVHISTTQTDIRE